GLAVNVAVSLIFVHLHRAGPLRDWCLPLVQANVLAAGVAALLWLAARRRLYAADPPDLATAPLLRRQPALGLLATRPLLAGLAGSLIMQPDPVGFLVRQGGEAGGWLALLAVLAAGGWYARLVSMRRDVRVLLTLGVAMGVQAAGTAARWDQGGWLAYHV